MQSITNGVIKKLFTLVPHAFVLEIKPNPEFINIITQGIKFQLNTNPEAANERIQDNTPIST